MSIIYKRGVRIFYVILSVSIILYIIPGKYKIAIYGLNLLGWVTVISVILTFIIFCIITYLDIKNKNYNALVKRFIALIIIIAFCKITSYYDAIRNESLDGKELKEIIGK
ncbi:MAG: hypothetical protein ABF246_03115 [Winogradskyella sp.]